VPEAAVVALTTPLILPGTTLAAPALGGHRTTRKNATPPHKAMVVKHFLVTIDALPVRVELGLTGWEFIRND